MIDQGTVHIPNNQQQAISRASELEKAKDIYSLVHGRSTGLDSRNTRWTRDEKDKTKRRSFKLGRPQR
jgi:hypothetical protein